MKGLSEQPYKWVMVRVQRLQSSQQKSVSKTQNKMDGEAFRRQHVRRLPSTKRSFDIPNMRLGKKLVGFTKMKPTIGRGGQDRAFENG